MSKTIKPWEKQEHKLYADIGRWSVSEKKFLLPNNKNKTCFVKNDPMTVAVLALTKDNKIIVAKQFRPGPETFMYELPGGHVEANEDLKEAAKRELVEETGFTSSSFIFVGDYSTCAYSSCRRAIFVAFECERTNDLREEDKDVVEVQELTMTEFRKHLLDGNVTDGYGAYMALDKIVWDIIGNL